MGWFTLSQDRTLWGGGFSSASDKGDNLYAVTVLQGGTLVFASRHDQPVNFDRHRSFTRAPLRQPGLVRTGLEATVFPGR